MGRFLQIASALLGFSALAVNAQVADPVEEAEASAFTGALNVNIKTSFPSAEMFGIKMINGHPTQALISFDNQEPEPVTINFVGGSLWTPTEDAAASQLVRNLTTTRYNVEIPAGESQTLPYNFATEMHPQDLKLSIIAILSDANRNFYNVQTFNGTVSIVEPDTSIFDPQVIFLYVFLLAAFAGTIYFFYNIWIAPYFPTKRTGGKDGSRAKRSSGGSKKVDPSAAVPVEGADGPAVTTGSKTYDESWIPAHHITRPEARRVKSGGRPKSRSKAE